eukprot:scaffold130111_cov67-Phaeocystis_antarctica.AAC.6
MYSLHHACSQAYPGSAGAQTTMYQLEVPSGVGPGEQFQAQVGDRMMVITCPAGAGPGSTIQARSRHRASDLPALLSPSSTLASSLRLTPRVPHAGCGTRGHCHRRALISATNGDRHARGSVRCEGSVRC